MNTTATSVGLKMNEDGQLNGFDAQFTADINLVQKQDPVRRHILGGTGSYSIAIHGSKSSAGVYVWPSSSATGYQGKDYETR